DIFTGDYVQPDRIREYLPEHKKGENPTAYDERRTHCDPDLSLGMLLNRIAGQLSSGKTDTVRRWSDPENPAVGLGDETDPLATAYRRTHNATDDAAAVPWEVFFDGMLPPMLWRRQEQWILVEGYEFDAAPQGEDPDAAAPERSRR